MPVPPPEEMIARIRALPAAAPLLARLGDEPAYLVGGAVRDLLLGGAPLDLDVVVEGDVTALAAKLGGEHRAYGRFGTGTVTLDGVEYDLATARRERYPYPGALPEVQPAPLADDLLRRDFTVNALAVALDGPQPGELVGAPGALGDLERGQLRVLHDRSFLDDPTRLLRLARYAARLGFDPDPRTARLAQEAVAGGALDTVSGDRLGTELRLLAREPDPLSALAWLARLDIDRALHPDFGLRERALAEAALALLPDGERRDRLVLAVAARRVAAPALPELLDRLSFPAADRDTIATAVAGAEDLAGRLSAARTPSEIAAAVAGLGPEAVALAGALEPRAQAAEWLERLRHVRLSINGEDLVAAGVPPGPGLGRGLRAALAAKLDGRAEGREAELEVAMRAAASPETR